LAFNIGRLLAIKKLRYRLETWHQLTPSLGMDLFEFLDELSMAKTGVLELSIGEDFVILACIILTQCQRVTGGRTERDTT